MVTEVMSELSSFNTNDKSHKTGNKLTRPFDLAVENQELELLRTLYPELSSDQLLAVKERLDGYFAVVLEVLAERFPSGNS